MRGLLRNLPLQARRRAAEAAKRAATLLRGLPPPVMATARRAAAPFRRLAPPVTRRAAAVAGSVATLPAKLPAPLRQRAAGLLGKLTRPLRSAGGPLRAWQRTAVAGVLAALLLLGGAMVAGAWASGPSDRILAGVKVAGLDVGGMTRDEAIQAVQTHLMPSLNRPIMIRIGAKSFRMTPAGVGRGRSVDQAVDQAFVGRIASEVAVAPVDAAFELRDGKVLKQHARSGRSLDQDAATKALIKVLGRPNRSELKLRLNPDPTGWGAGEPLVIPPGPGNPLGTRAMALNAPGILIHGSYATGSIGSYASHGCIRMAIWDAEDIF